MLATIPIRHITEGTRLRPANEAQVAALVASIRDVGILNPITVYPRKVIVDHIAVDGYGIVAGLHRYTACKELGVEEIPANVVTLGELERQIAECDENLCGPKLSSAEKSLFTRRRKEAYEALHGSAKARGAHAANEAMGNDNAMANLADAFTTDTATRTGSSERAVRRDAERGEKIADDVLDMITGTHLDSGAYQDQIKNLTHVEQRARVNADLDKRRREQQFQEKQSRDDHEARIGAEWIADAIGRNNLVALITILESVPLRKLCAELRRA